MLFPLVFHVCMHLFYRCIFFVFLMESREREVAQLLLIHLVSMWYFIPLEDLFRAQ